MLDEIRCPRQGTLHMEVLYSQYTQVASTDDYIVEMR